MNNLPISQRTFNQRFELSRSTGVKGEKITVTLRFDDSCKNGYNEFAITGTITNYGYVKDCGHIPKDIEKYFPEFQKYIKWHLCSTKGPMYYLENTLYHAGDSENIDKPAGTPIRHETIVRFGENPIQHTFNGSFMKFLQGSNFNTLEICKLEDNSNYRRNPKYSFNGYAIKERYLCPFNTSTEAENFLYALQNCNPIFETIATDWVKSKEPNLEYARQSAIWPTATLEQLRDKEQLLARLPQLMQEFQADMIELGFTY
jgi:hypothetical protein